MPGGRSQPDMAEFQKIPSVTQITSGLTKNSAQFSLLQDQVDNCPGAPSGPGEHGSVMFGSIRIPENNFKYSSPRRSILSNIIVPRGSHHRYHCRICSGYVQDFLPVWMGLEGKHTSRSRHSYSFSLRIPVPLGND